MKIEVFHGSGSPPIWYWHFRARNGRITANNESFPTKAHATRAAKGVVRSILNVTGGKAKFKSQKAGSVTVIFI